jgi:intein/homing endonuclease
MALSKIEKEKIQKVFDDPVLWAKAHVLTYDQALKKIVPWTARWYQAEMLRDKSRKKVYRCGRRTGKCLPGDVLIFDPTTGENIPIEELYKRQQANVLAMNESSFKLTSTETTIVLDNGIKDVYRVTLKTGKQIEATGNHPFYKITGWTELDDLKIGDKIATPRILNYFGNEKLEDEKIKFLAYIIGDGNCLNKNLRFSVASDKIKTEMEEIVSYFDCELVQYESSKKYDYSIVKKEYRTNKTVPNLAKEFLIEQNVYGKNSHEKTIPNIIFKLPKEKISLFLSRLYATDGWASKKEIGYCSVNRKLIEQIQHLLLRFGIRSSISHKHKVGAYQLIINNQEGIRTFAKDIGIFSKDDALNNVLIQISKIKEKPDTIPKEIVSEIKDEIKTKGLNYNSFVKNKNDRIRDCYGITRNKLKMLANNLNNERFKNLSESDLYWDEVISIEYIGKKQTYDLTIPVYHNFVANDIIVHNTETMCVEALYQTNTNKEFVFVFVAPYENQIRLIFTRLMELINGSPLVKARLVGSTKNPYIITFLNNSRIVGFTTGASSNSGGASIRGQRANMIACDEMDYLGDGDFENISMLAAERPDIRIVTSSTPTGRRGEFWKICTNKNIGYVEHYHPSTHNPNWSDQMEAEFRAELTELGYIHEVLADFGPQDTGVFNKEDIDKARQFDNYAYNELTRAQLIRLERTGDEPPIMYEPVAGKFKRNIFRTMGVDWDKTA